MVTLLQNCILLYSCFYHTGFFFCQNRVPHFVDDLYGADILKKTQFFYLATIIPPTKSVSIGKAEVTLP